MTQGYSKDHRADLKPVVVSWLCTSRSAIPVWLEALSGNSAEKTMCPPTIQASVAQLQAAEPPCFMADSALDSQDMLKALSAVRWSTRVPDTLREARDLWPRVELGERQPSAPEGSRDREVDRQDGGVPQRWLVVFSQPAYAREVTTCQQQLSRHQEQAQKQLWPLSHQEFATEDAARVAIAAMEKPWGFHRAQVPREPVAHDGRRGRPRTEETPQQVRWRVVGQVVADPATIAALLKRKGKFMLATNEREAERLPPETMVSAYKAQGVSVERGCRFLKAPLFCADSLLVKRPERLMALLMVMGLALLV